jgi:hypothetical protein
MFSIIECMANLAKGAAISEVEEARVRAQVSVNVRAVENSMVLEGQGVGKVEEWIERETQRVLAEMRRKRNGR